jgi:hypothetical protein
MHGCLKTVALLVVAWDKLDLFVIAEVALSLCEVNWNSDSSAQNAF